MLESQKNFAIYLKKLHGLLNDYAFSFDQTLLEKVLETELVVPVIGAFSAGKSSLLNTLIGQNVLPVGIAPETELATELRYSAEPYLLAIKPNGDQERLPVEALSTINQRSDEFSHLRLYINSENLKAISPLVLVDMPGFGSSLENHNKAISYYLPRGVHFVVLTSVEDGNIGRSMWRQLDELKTYETDFTFLLSKCNLRAADQVKEIQTYINDQLEVFFDKHYACLTVSNESSAELVKALSFLQPDALFSDLFIDILKEQSFEIQEQIKLTLSTLKKDKAESITTLRAFEQALSKLQEEHENAAVEIKEHSEKMLDRSLRDLDHAFNESLEELSSLGSKNPNALSNALSDIIRNSLSNTVKSEVQTISMQMVDQIASSLSATNQQMATLNIGGNWNEALAEKVKQSLKQTTTMLNNWSSNIQEQAAANANKNATIYRSLSTVLAVTTNVVNPLVELALIFLPDIIRLLSGNGNEREQLRQKLTNEVFPNIKAELRGKIPAIIKEQLNAMLKKINDSFEEQITKQKQVVESVTKENLQLEVQINEKTADLENLAIAVEKAATEHLYK